MIDVVVVGATGARGERLVSALCAAGLSVRWVGGVGQAVTEVTERAPDAVLVDLALGECLDLTARLRADPALGATRLVAMAAVPPHPADRGRADMFLLKPVPVALVVAALRGDPVG